MALANYTNIADSVATWLNREGFSSLTDQVEDLIAIAQRRIFREDLRCLENVDSAFTIDSQTEAIPTGLLRVKAISIVQGSDHYEVNGAPLKTVLSAGQNGRPYCYTLVGDTLYFGPTPDQSYTATVVYYKGLTPLSTSNATNWLSDNCPELVLYGAMYEASMFLKDDARAQIWSGRYQQTLNDLLMAEERSDLEGGSLQVR